MVKSFVQLQRGKTHESDWTSSDNIELFTDSSGNQELGFDANGQVTRFSGHAKMFGSVQI